MTARGLARLAVCSLLAGASFASPASAQMPDPNAMS